MQDLENHTFKKIDFNFPAHLRHVNDTFLIILKKIYISYLPLTLTMINYDSLMQLKMIILQCT